MKAAAPSSFLAWPHGVDVKVSDGKIILQPRPRPRQDWANKFRRPARKDELEETREVRNKFDAEEWQW